MQLGEPSFTARNLQSALLEEHKQETQQAAAPIYCCSSSAMLSCWSPSFFPHTRWSANIRGGGAACSLLFYPTRLGYFRQQKKAHGKPIPRKQCTDTTHRYSEPSARPAPKAAVSRGFQATRLHGVCFLSPCKSNHGGKTHIRWKPG